MKQKNEKKPNIDYSKCKTLTEWLRLKYGIKYKTYSNKSKDRKDSLREEFAKDTGIIIPSGTKTKTQKIAEQKICPICGKCINNSVNVDHVYPRALYKWTECYIPKNDYKKLRGMISSADNLTYTHVKCNTKKEDEIPDISKLYISDQQKQKLDSLRKSLLGTIHFYESKKADIRKKQHNTCACCKKPLENEGTVRRVNWNDSRLWDNACIVCHECNGYRYNSLKKKGMTVYGEKIAN